MVPIKGSISQLSDVLGCRPPQNPSTEIAAPTQANTKTPIIESDADVVDLLFRPTFGKVVRMLNVFSGILLLRWGRCR